LLGADVPLNPFKGWTEPTAMDNANIFDKVAWNADVSTTWKKEISFKHRGFKCEANCITVLITFPLLFFFHLFIMIFPMGWWAGSNLLLFFYTLYIFGQMMISLGFAIEAPLLINLDFNQR
jgi:hypothetical protein